MGVRARIACYPAQRRRVVWGAPSKTVPITAERIEPLKVPARNCVKHYNATVSLGLGARTS